MSGFKVGDKVILDPKGQWSQPITIKHAKEGIVGTVSLVNLSGNLDIQFPGGAEAYNVSKKFTLPANTQRDVKAETIEFLKGQKETLVKRVKVAQEEAQEASAREQALEFQIAQIDSMVETLNPKPRLEVGMSVVIDDPLTTSHGKTRTVLSVHPDGTFATEAFPQAHYKGWKLP